MARSFLDRGATGTNCAVTQRTALVAAATRPVTWPARPTAHPALASACLPAALLRRGARVHAWPAVAGCTGSSATAPARPAPSVAPGTAGAQAGYADALGHSEQALRLFRVAGQPARAGHALQLRGLVRHALLGDHSRPLGCCQQALALNHELCDRYGEAHTWDSLGYAERKLGHLATATTCYQHALRIFREVGARYNEADTLANIGDTRHESAATRLRPGPPGRRPWLFSTT